MPLTLFSVSSKALSGQMSPSKPSGMPMTFHLYLRMAALTTARMTAFRPGASPPPVPMPMQRMSDILSSVWPFRAFDNVTRHKPYVQVHIRQPARPYGVTLIVTLFELTVVPPVPGAEATAPSVVGAAVGLSVPIMKAWPVQVVAVVLVTPDSV